MEDLIKDLKNNNEKFSEEYLDMMKEYYTKMTSNPETGENRNAKIQNPNQPDEEGGIIITGEPVVCVKTTDSTGQKIFINILSHDKIEGPNEEHVLEMQNQLGVRLPLSLSEKLEDFDTKGNMCQVYDVIFNTNVVHKAENDTNVFHFMVQLVTERIKQRFNHILSINVIKMKHMKYKGKAVRSQRVRVKKGPKIEEIIKKDNDIVYNNSQNNLLSKEINKEINEKGKTPNWNFVILVEHNPSLNTFKSIAEKAKDLINKKYKTEDFINNNDENKKFIYFDGSNASPKYGKSFLFFIELNILSKSNAINLNICDEGFVLNCGKIYSLDIGLPYKINSKESFSVFDIETRFLFIILPFYQDDILELQDKNEQNGILNNINVTDDYIFDVIN